MHSCSAREYHGAPAEEVAPRRRNRRDVDGFAHRELLQGALLALPRRRVSSAHCLAQILIALPRHCVSSARCLLWSLLALPRRRVSDARRLLQILLTLPRRRASSACGLLRILLALPRCRVSDARSLLKSLDSRALANTHEQSPGVYDKRVGRCRTGS